ncbi:CoA transferase [Streptomyces platensis]|uniref:CoA transferase n=1 Tax=Streptomyces platensis TaxID=58346 RepID=UPI0033D77BEE
MATTADVVVENFRPGTAARLGLGPRTTSDPLPARPTQRSGHQANRSAGSSIFSSRGE